MDERWLIHYVHYGSTRTMERFAPVRETVVHTIREMATAPAAELAISPSENEDDFGMVEGPPTLVVNASDGRYSVIAYVRDDTEVELVGDPHTFEKIPYVVGGQVVDNYPERHVVTVDQAVAAALEFFETGAVSGASGLWEPINSF